MTHLLPAAQPLQTWLIATFNPQATEIHVQIENSEHARERWISPPRHTYVRTRETSRQGGRDVEISWDVAGTGMVVVVMVDVRMRRCSRRANVLWSGGGRRKHIRSGAGG